MKKIWEDGEDKPKPLTEKTIAKAEKMLKVKLPDSYIHLLKQQNGGYIIYNAFPTNKPNSWAEDHIYIDRILGITKEDGILDTEYLIQEWGLPTDIVLFSGDGHSWIAFDYRKTKEEPPIIYIDTEDEQIIELATSFQMFLDGLYLEDEEEVEEDIDDENELREYKLDELKVIFSNNDESEIYLALNYLLQNAKGNEYFIEKELIKLLQSPILDFKQIAANFAHRFNEMGILSVECITKMVSIIQNDKEIEYYAEMYFSEN